MLGNWCDMIRLLQNFPTAHELGRVFVLSVALLGLLMCTACSENAPHSLRIEGLELVVKNINDECIGSKSTPEEIMTEGVLDIRFADSYKAFPVIHNVMPPAETGIVLENHHMYLVGVNLEYTVPPATGDSADLEQSLSDFLPDDFVYTAGFVTVGEMKIVPVDVIPADVVATIKAEIGKSSEFLQWFNSVKILVRMTLEARLLDGRTIISNQYTFPLDICNGCLLQSPPQATCCTAGQPAVFGEFLYPCRFGNDEPVDCRACCQYFGPNAVDVSGKPLCENPVCGDGICEGPVESVDNCPADCS